MTFACLDMRELTSGDKAWGAWLLLKIGRTGTFTGVTIHEVSAHGHAQIVGWVGLFIMGFAQPAGVPVPGPTP